jgi:diguanylate cyclase (GGDEF)-like protein
MKRAYLLTTLFTAVICALGTLVFTAIAQMRDEANNIDDARAVHAAQAAVRSIEARLESTVRDNAVWDDAFEKVGSADAVAWIYESWGKVSLDYPLYDAAVVLTPQQGVLSAYRKGVEFAPYSYFGASLQKLVAAAASAGQSPVTAFIATADGTYIVAAGTIQPFTEKTVDAAFSTLVFAKLLSEDVVAQLDETFNIDGLKLVALPERSRLSTPLLGLDGRAVAYLEWPSRIPGTHIFEAVQDYLLVAAGLLIIFVVAIIVTGVAVIRALQRDAAMAHHKATHDALSGLLNRTGLLEVIGGSRLGSSRGPALGMIDLDGFKDVNDAWGHAIGDELIKLVADRLGAACEPPPTLARLGGDEFAFLTAPDEVAKVADLLIQALYQPFRIGGRTIEVGASIGTAIASSDVHDGYELLRRADMALYQAKESGRGRVVTYAAALDVARHQRAELEEKLRVAIARKEIYPVFQPLVDAKTGVLRGVEALARWTPEGGPVSPELFIGVAERAGLIDELGRNILDMSLEAASNWQDIGLSVNVSPVQLRNPDFAGMVQRILKERDFDPARLTLEITEGVLMSNPDHAKRTIAGLRSIGVKFALDDFGCGYASIGALREFGFDRMKIDRSLIVALNEERGAGILSATLLLAKALHIPVTAEGVETQEQADALVRSGCDQLQGYLVGRPMQRGVLEELYLSSAA